jgi:predicted CopG family antitoxin
LTKLRHIVLDEQNYQALKKLGCAGDSFNDVVTDVLKRLQLPQTFAEPGPAAVSATKWVRSDG